MKQKNSNKLSGFTLIELMAVVLIIGILTAIAFPQYQKALERSRYAEYQILANSIAEAVEAYEDANEDWPKSFDVLDVQLPADMTTETEFSSGICRKNDKLYCCITFPRVTLYIGSVMCAPNDARIVQGRKFAEKDSTPSRAFVCYAQEEKYKALCKAISGASSPTRSSTGVLTPSGLLFGYASYTIE